MDERARDYELLPHPVAVALDQLVSPLLEIEQRHQLSSPVLELVTVLPVKSANEAQEFSPGELLVNEWAVGNEAELRFRSEWIFGEIDSREMNAAGGGLQDSRDHAQCGCLP